MKKKCVRNLILAAAACLGLFLPAIPALASGYEFRTEENGKMFWYENGVRQGTYDDNQGILGDGTNRGREIFDSVTDAWYWLDSCYDGAKAVGKEVWIPYIYQNELINSPDGYGRMANGISDEATITELASQSITDEADMSAQVAAAIKGRTGKWVRYDEYGRMLKGWVTIEGDLAQYYQNQIGNTYYYDRKTGMMAKGWLTINGRLYHFNEESGVLDYAEPVNDPEINPADNPRYNTGSILTDVKNLVEDYDPDGYILISDEAANNGNSRLESWCTGEDVAARAADTCVHESFHAYTGDNWDYYYDYDNAHFVVGYGFFIDSNKTIYIWEGDSFITEEWSSTIPETLRTFRYDPYVVTGSDLSSNVDGAYGLINEFSAYCWGLNDQVLLYPYYQSIGDIGDVNGCFRNAVINGTQAFTEFRFYILGYLNYAKTYYPNIYDQFINNQDFVNVYCIMERRFENLLKQIENLGEAYWTNEAYRLYTETSKPEYQAVEQEMFSKATEVLLPSYTFNPQHNPNESEYTSGEPIVIITSLAS